MLLMAVDVENRFRNSMAHLPLVCFAKYSVEKGVLRSLRELRSDFRR